MLTQLLTLTTTHKFPSLDGDKGLAAGGGGWVMVVVALLKVDVLPVLKDVLVAGVVVVVVVVIVVVDAVDNRETLVDLLVLLLE